MFVVLQPELGEVFEAARLGPLPGDRYLLFGKGDAGHMGAGQFGDINGNSLRLAADLMEPFRPFMDLRVAELSMGNGSIEKLTREMNPYSHTRQTF